MELGRKLLAALFVALLTLATAACNASGEVNEDGAGLEVEGEGEGEEGDD